MSDVAQVSADGAQPGSSAEGNRRWLWLALSVFMPALGVILFCVVVRLVRKALFPQAVFVLLPAPGPTEDFQQMISHAGLLIALQIVYFYALRSMNWTGKPLSEANLGSITQLQWAITPQRVKNVWQRWVRLITPEKPTAEPESAERPPEGEHATKARQDDGFYDKQKINEALGRMVAGTLYRDLWGFIPVYTCFLVFALWFAKDFLAWCESKPDSLWQLYPLWLIIPLLTAVADIGEDVCHLSYLRRLVSSDAKPAWPYVIIAVCCTVIKSIGFLTGVVLAMAAITQGVWILLQPRIAPPGWRGTVAILIFYVLVAAFVLPLLYKAVVFLKYRKDPSKKIVEQADVEKLPPF